ncbi:hypothetical protein FOZ63_004019 [Perkinsus olseni]|uniref:Uncharacterized protein n=1 Tax=Perkinsus olseni TaxID=32597 RepID=A0A7J6TW82_PEROL|nr:hypothetical protein FOZ62_014273 [Perkinsus olseni]KAF4749508.1 hypothetical protein FOZ63_004019 [Perkinsus olseni]
MPEKHQQSVIACNKLWPTTWNSSAALLDALELLDHCCRRFARTCIHGLLRSHKTSFQAGIYSSSGRLFPWLQYYHSSLAMYTTMVIFAIAGSGTGEIDWSTVTLEPPVDLAPGGGQVDLSGIILEPPVDPAPAGSEVDLNGITLEPPVQLATPGSQIDWSGVSLEGPVHPATTEVGLDWPSITLGGPGIDQPEKQK